MSEPAQFPSRGFERALRRLADPETGRDPRLIRLLSAPTPNDLACWCRLWPAIDPDQRRWIARCLLETAEVTFEVDFEALFVRLLHDEDPEIRIAAIDGLWEVEEPLLIDTFVDLLRRDGDARVRAHAAAALGTYVRLGELGEIGGRQAGFALDVLVEAATDDSEEVDVRRRATESAGFGDRPEVRVLIRDALASHERPLRAGALRAMGRSADASWGPSVLERLDDRSPELRFEAVRAAGELLLANAVPMLLTLAEGDNREIQLEAIWALGEIGNAPARRALERVAAWAVEEDLAAALEEAMVMAALSDGEITWPALDRASPSPFPGTDETDEDVRLQR